VRAFGRSSGRKCPAIGTSWKNCLHGFAIDECYVKQSLLFQLEQEDTGKRFADGTDLEKSLGRYRLSRFPVCQPIEAYMQSLFTVSKPNGKAQSIQRRELTFGKFLQARYRAFNRNQDILLNNLTRDFECIDESF
jgi:hypothetical protein